MSDTIALIGDIHGCIKPLRAALRFIDEQKYASVVFLGDYIDRGSDSFTVISELSARFSDSRFHFLRGNHEEALLHSLNKHDLGTFFSVGGASTILSYIGDSSDPDVLNAFIKAIPTRHMEFLQSTTAMFSTKTLVAGHQLQELPHDGRFRIAGHQMIGPLPRVTNKSALIDTGCGSGGKLTLLEYPSLRFHQF